MSESVKETSRDAISCCFEVLALMSKSSSPDMDSLERLLRRLKGHVERLAVTARSMESDLVDAWNAFGPPGSRGEPRVVEDYSQILSVMEVAGTLASNIRILEDKVHDVHERPLTSSS